MPDLSVILLHEGMLDKEGKLVTTSLTLLDVHDFARSTRTFGVTTCFIAHPSPTLQSLTRTLKEHWEAGFGAEYNPTRGEALSQVDVVASLDDAIAKIDLRTGKLPTLVATSARKGPDRMPYSAFRKQLEGDPNPYLLMFGTGWGMCEALTKRAKVFLEPVLGPSEYNHLSVRSACAIILDRLRGS